MQSMVQVALAGTVEEAEELTAILTEAGIPSELEPAVTQHPRELDETLLKVLVPEDRVEEAQDAIEAMTEPDELIGES
jgi:hypothetical protein